MKIVITGASGFLGKALHKMLLEQGNEVYGFTRNSIDGLICVSDYKHLPKIDDAVLVHLAQSRNTSTFYDHDEVDLCCSLAERKWSHVVYASSSVVYGDKEQHFHLAEEAVTPFNAYSKMKIECEKVFSSVGGTCLRFSNLYGPNMSSQSVIADILRQIPGEGPLKIMDSTPVRDFLWIDDGVDCIAVACSANTAGIFNAGSGATIAVGDLASLAMELAGEKKRTIATTCEPSYVSCLKIDIAKTISRFSWSPTIDLRNGLLTLLEAKR